MTPPKRRQQSLAPLIFVSGVVIGLASAAYYLYSSYSSTNTNRQEDQSNRPSEASKNKAKGKKKSRKSSKEIAIILSKQLIEQGIPIAALLEKFPNLVFIYSPADFISQNEEIPHDIADLELPKEIDAQLGQTRESHLHKFIPCLTSTGAMHVLKHLRSQTVMIPKSLDEEDDGWNIQDKDIQNFVGEIIRVPDLVGEDEENAHQLEELFRDLLS